MKSGKKISVFLTAIIYIAITAQFARVDASQAVYDEIEKIVVPQEETQSEKPANKEVTPSSHTNTEEHASVEEEKPSENETQSEQVNTEEKQQSAEVEKNNENKSAVQKTKPAEEKPEPEKKQVVKVKEEDLSRETPVSTEPVTAVPEEPPVSEQKSKIDFSVISKIYNKCTEFFSISYDKIIELKERIVWDLTTYRYGDTLCCRQMPERKKIEDKKEVLPYYFIFPGPIKDHLEKIAFTNEITNPLDVLPYHYALKYYGDKIETPEKLVTPQGTTDYRVLLNAPSPEIEVTGTSLFVKLIIDIRNNTLYKYDKDGFPLKAYLVATGAIGSRTRPGLRIVSYTDTFPYRGAPNSKRAVDPYSYGPFIFFLNAVNPQTGRQYAVDQLLHGNGNEYSIGRKVSHGCVRMNNHVMRHEISKEVKRGDYILLINPD